MLQIAPQRLDMQAAFDVICSKYPTWALWPGRVDAIRRMERSCFNEAIADCARAGIIQVFSEQRFVQRYSTICARVISNLDVSIGTYLIDGIINGTIDVYGVGTMSSKELCPEAGADLRSAIEIRQNQSAIVKVSRAHQCKKCGKNETTFKNYQGRAADECENQSIKCINCGNVWRM